MPLDVVDCKQVMFKGFTYLLEKAYESKCPFPIQTVRQIKIYGTEPQLLSYRESFSGTWSTSVITQNQAMVYYKVYMEVLWRKYNGSLPLSQANYKDIMSLLQFCSS